MVYTETVKLDDQVTGAAQKASAAVGDLAGQTENFGQRMARLKAARKPLTDVGQGFTEVGQSASQAGAGLADAATGEAAAGEGAASLFAELSVATGGLIDVAAVAFGAVGAFAALTAAGAAFAIKSSEAKNASLSLWSALGEGVITGGEVDDMLDDLRAKTGITKDSLGEFTTGFLKLGITGKESLQELTIAAASAEALVKGGGDAFVALTGKIDAAAEAGQKLTIAPKKLTGQLAALGLNINDIANQMGVTGAVLTEQLKAGTVDAKKFGDALTDAVTKKGAGPMQTLANSSANLGKLLQEYLGDLFEDLGNDIAPFMAAVKDLFSILDSKANPSGQALKAGIGGFFKEVFADAAKVVPMVKHFLLDVIIYGLKAYIALKPVAQAVMDFGASIVNNQPIMDGLKMVLLGVGIALGILVAGAVLTAAAVGALVAVIIGIQVAIVAAGLAIMGFIVEAGAALNDWVVGAATAAADFVSGLVTGIGNGASQVVGAVKGLADGAINAFKGALDINSPSKVMMDLGGHTGTGFAMGLDDTGPDVHGAAGGVADMAVKGASDAAQAPSAGGGASNVNTFNIIINGADKSVTDLSREALATAWEAAAMGAGL